MFRTTRRIFLAGALATAMGTGAWAQTYPDRPIHIIAPFPPGGLVDVLARALGDEMSRSMGQPVVVENKPGAGGNIGADIAAKAAPDGYTLLMTSPGIQSINQFLYKSMPFDPDKAFVPISMVADMSMVVVVHPKTGITTLKQLVDFAHAHPGKLNFGSAGIGTTGHLGLELLMHAGHMKFTHVPYKGAAPSVTDLIAGQIDGVVDNPPTVLAHIKAGSIRALAVAGKERLSVLPDVPTAAEAGLPDWEASSWFGLVAPAGTSKAIVDRLHAEVVKAVKSPRIQKMRDRGMRIVGDTPKEFGDLIVAERKKWGEIITSAHITVQ
ncbi:MAG TPA: tripartite tricarboxylate transporter substrate binding protein [Pseudolabrys sp.]|jgi:tripartite-type tricarboxylate transporter receptor subunit TctC|uniref:Bug family tripartite tricarboxylate transporter substrate binding protein n=1 Tax=Pseudolabrys sp. TaxID=1960880 RepID=UPI002DDD772C|nr:tripartite tricarboxylate transporter substrate binding protein [Pseudolabrys sp.]HEV2629273.1 tripartite tricarboxylate transporter substrate binding protein [Pseudolabrys sp.]